jgi:hypothetical protein
MKDIYVKHYTAVHSAMDIYVYSAVNSFGKFRFSRVVRTR